MKYNYQIMTKKSENGKYIPDMEILKNNASCQEEIDYLEQVEADWNRYRENGHLDFVGFAFNMCYVMRQACGHFEIFQTHVNSEKEAMEWLKLMETESKTRECTDCICGYKYQ